MGINTMDNMVIILWYYDNTMVVHSTMIILWQW